VMICSMMGRRNEHWAMNRLQSFRNNQLKYGTTPIRILEFLYFQCCLVVVLLLLMVIVIDIGIVVAIVDAQFVNGEDEEEVSTS